MIPIIIPGSVVRAASDGLKSIDDKVTGGAVQSKTGEAKKAAAEAAEKKKKEAEESEAGKAVAAKAKEASAAIDDGLGRFSKWRAEKAMELEAWVDEVRGPTVVAAPGEQPPNFPPEQVYYPNSTNLRFQLMRLPAGMSPGDRLATPTGEPFDPPRNAAVGCTLKVPLPNPVDDSPPTSTTTVAIHAPAVVSAGEHIEAQCKKQHPVMGVWLDRYARIEGKRLSFFDKPRDQAAPSSGVEDVAGCSIRLGREKFTFDGNQYLITLERRGHGSLPDLEDAGLLKFSFKLEEDRSRFVAALQLLGCTGPDVTPAAGTTPVIAAGAPATAIVVGPAKASSTLCSLIGSTVLQRSTTIDTSTALAGRRFIGLYFSASWCPPCRAFTPALVEWYKKHAKIFCMEIVFVSSDKDDNTFRSYFSKMPWLGLPYKQRSIKQKLAKKFGVTGLPCLIILDADGRLCTTNGREEVSKGNSGLASFPWKPGGEPAPEAAAAVAAAKKSFWNRSPSSEQHTVVATATPTGVAVAFGEGGGPVRTTALMPIWVDARIVPAESNRSAAAAQPAATAGHHSDTGASQPEPEPARVWKYKALGAGVIRSGVSKTSEEAGRLTKGEVIEVFEIVAQADGIVRVHFDRGWTSVTTKQGKQLLKLLEEEEQAL